MHNCNNSRKHDCLCHVLLFCSLVSQIIFFASQSVKDGWQTHKYILHCSDCTLLHNKYFSTYKSKCCRLIARELKCLSSSLLRKTGGLLVVTQNILVPIINIFIFSSEFNKLPSGLISIAYFYCIFFPFFLLHFISLSWFHFIFFCLDVVISSFLIIIHMLRKTGGL